MFKEVRPATQPRTLRSIAETQNDASNFTLEPAPLESGYHDAAEAARPSLADARRPLSSADKQPFKNLK